MKILLVCLGNICRSPMAEGIMRKKAEERKLNIYFDSAGTGDWHAGENPDPRAISAAHKFGVNISDLVARQFIVSDFDDFDKIFAMDQSNFNDIIAISRSETDRQKVELILNHLPNHQDKNVPDPWYGGADGFISVFHLLEDACESYLNQL